MKNNAKILLKILAGIVAFIIIGFIFVIYNAFCGNFISGMYYKAKVEAYIAQTYPDKHYTVSDYHYNFKMTCYEFDVTDPESEDGSFSAYYSDSERKVVDTYENVLNMTNTLMRLEKEFRHEVDPLIERHLDTKEKTVDGNYIGGEFGYATCIFDDFDEHTLKDRLYLDMTADPKNMPVPTQVYVNLKSDGNEALRRVKELAMELDTLGYRIDYYDFSTNDKPYETVPVERVLGAETIDDLEEFVMPDYDKPKEE